MFLRCTSAVLLLAAKALQNAASASTPKRFDYRSDKTDLSRKMPWHSAAPARSPTVQPLRSEDEEVFGAFPSGDLLATVR
jgi:hypothetical protein